MMIIASGKGRWELIDGIPFSMYPLPSPKHQWINTNITHELKLALKKCKHCKVYMPIDWEINHETVVQPDASLVCGEIQGHYLRFPPKVTFEILSEGTEKKDRVTKRDLYYSAKVKYYVLVLPEEEAVEVYQWSKKGYQVKLKGHSAVFEFDLDECKFTFDFKNIWS